MIKNYFKTAFRNFWKNKTSSAINIFGLTIGMTSCLLIALYIQHELSYDNFEQKGNRISRVIMEYKFDGGAEFRPVHLLEQLLEGAVNVELARRDGAGRCDVRKIGDDLREGLGLHEMLDDEIVVGIPLQRRLSQGFDIDEAHRSRPGPFTSDAARRGRARSRPQSHG